MPLQIITLGTGAGRPTLTRGSAAIALVHDHGWTLFDCGEGTLLQLQRAGLRSSRLRMVCISHMHGDHINGLPGLLGSLALERHPGPLSLIGPPGFLDYLSTLQRLHVFTPIPGPPPIELTPPGGLILSDDTCSLTALPLQHRIPTFGYRWTEPPRPGRFDLDAAQRLGIPPGPLFGHLRRGIPITLPDGRTVQPNEIIGDMRPGQSIAYCSDTIYPCEGALQLAQDVDFLIHEGTYGPEFESLALKYGHSTVSQAAQVATSARASKLLITHISPKHSHETERLLSDARLIFPASHIAQDLEVYSV